MLAVIPFYQRRDHLDRCLAALAASTHPITPWVHNNDVQNLGFTKAINLGLRAALARGDEYVLLINQDCYVEHETVGTLVEFMTRHPRCAIAGSMQLLPNDPDVIYCAGGYQLHPQPMVRRGRRSAGHWQESVPVVHVHGACMFARLEAVREFGLMDESMVLFSSDVDWSLTARSRGWETWYCAEARVLHETGVSEAGQANSPEIGEIMDRDRDYFRRKWARAILFHELDRMPGQPRTLNAANIESELQKAAAHREAERFGEAEATYRNVLAADPNNLPALKGMAWLMWTQVQNATIACDYLERAVTVAPADADVRGRYAMALDVMRRTDRAVREYLEAARLEEMRPQPRPQRIEEIAARLRGLGRESEAAAVEAKLQAMRSAGGSRHE